MSPLSALIAAIVVPCTIAITFAVMKAAGMTFNMMTLGGLAAGIGLFIDDAIVMIEAIHRARMPSAPARQAAIAGDAARIGRPLVASTVTVIVVFIPLVFLSGVTGVFFRALALTLGAGLAISLLLALYFTPALEVRSSDGAARAASPGECLTLVQQGLFAQPQAVSPLPGAAPCSPRPVLAARRGSIARSGLIICRRWTKGLHPGLHDSAGKHAGRHRRAAGQNRGRAQDHAGGGRRSRAAPARSSASFLTESNRGDISVRLKSNRTRGIDEVMDSVRRRILASVPGVSIEFSQVLQDLIGDLSGTPEPIEVKVFGADQATIEIDRPPGSRNRLSQIPGMVDVRSTAWC